ncbi:MAG: hypothetical protein ACHQ5A_00520 [Opitutales bacterium]
MRAVHACLVLGTAMGLLAGPGRAMEVGTEAGLTYSDNLSRTSYVPYRMSATVESASVSLTEARQITPGWLLVATGEAGTELVPRFTAIDTWRSGLLLLARHKFGLGPMAPVLELNAGAEAVSVHESGRSGWQTTAGLTLAKRITETWRVAASTGTEDFTAGHHPFDIRGHDVQLETDWDVTQDWRLTLGARRRWGQLTANADGDIYQSALAGAFGPRVSNYYWQIPWEASNTFGPGWVAYRVDCYADFQWAQVSYAVNANTSLPLRYETVKVVNRAGVRYDTHLWSLNLVHRF